MKEHTENKPLINVTWTCPSNIAIVKYWGKKEHQIPCNSSLSMTLSNAFTTIEAAIFPKTSDEEIQLDYFFENKINEKFNQRIQKFLSDQAAFLPLVNAYHLVIHSSNSFPHSTGIASSASAFGAISLALLDIQYLLDGKEKNENFFQTASHLARLGSGSASRSIYPGFVLLGKNHHFPHSSNELSMEVKDIHPVFQQMKDAILIVENQPKKVSSSVGHSLMNSHPFSEKRFQQANERTDELISLLQSGDIDAFIQLCESEALTLHAMMMTSKDYYLLMKPNTLEIIDRVFSFRNQTKIPLCFTLDAGPNLHLLYPKEYETKVNAFIQHELSPFTTQILFDEIGKGPKKIN